MNRQPLNLVRTLAVLLAVVAVLAATALPSHAQVQTIYHSIPGVTGFDLPGGFTAVPNGYGEFGRPVVNGRGDWLVYADTDNPSATDIVLYYSNTVLLQEGTATPFATGENWGTPYPFDISDSGKIAIATNTDGATSADEYLVTYEGDAWSVVAQEGQPTGLIADTYWGDTLGGSAGQYAISSGGVVSFIAENVTGSGVTAGLDDRFAVVNGVLVAQNGVTVPGNQLDGGSRALRGGDSLDTVYANSDGSSYLLVSNYEDEAYTNNIVIVDGDVVLEGGMTIPGFYTSVATAGGIDVASMDGAGSWYAQGENVDDRRWIVRDGQKLVAEGDPVAGGANVWTNNNGDPASGVVFLDYSHNDVGDVAIIGYDETDYVAPDSNEVLVLNNSDLIAREGDPVDLDNNGLFDDGVFWHQFLDTDLANDGTVYFTANLRDGSGALVGSGFFVDGVVPEPASLVLLVLGAVALASMRQGRR